MIRKLEKFDNSFNYILYGSLGIYSLKWTCYIPWTQDTSKGALKVYGKITFINKRKLS